MLLPIIVIIAAVRAAFMVNFKGTASSDETLANVILLIIQIFQMNYHDDRIQWECDNGGQQWNQTIIDDGMTFTNETVTGVLLPDKFCDIGVHQTYLTFVFCLLIDFILLCYAWFLDWRMLARIKHAYKLIQRDSCEFNIKTMILAGNAPLSLVCCCDEC